MKTSRRNIKKANTIVYDWLKENSNPEIEELVSLEAKLLSGEDCTKQEVNRIKELRNKYF